MRFVSLMQFPITIVTSTGTDVVIPPSGEIALVRASEVTSAVEVPATELTTEAGTFAVRAARAEAREAVKFVELKGGKPFPDPEEGVAYLVNAVTLEALRGSGRDDVYAPDTGETARRDEANRVIAVFGLIPVGL